MPKGVMEKTLELYYSDEAKKMQLLQLQQEIATTPHPEQEHKPLIERSKIIEMAKFQMDYQVKVM